MKISEFLASMGNNADEVADYCRAFKLTGEILNPLFCPITKAIYHRFPNLSPGLRVVSFQYPAGYRRFGDYGYLFCEARTEVKVTWNDCQTIDPDTPRAIYNFVLAFDAKKYPDLIGKSQKELKQETLAGLTAEQKLALGI